MINKIVLILSLIINSVLIMFVTGPLPFLLLLSVLINAGLGLMIKNKWGTF